MASYIPPDPNAFNSSCAFEIGESKLHILDLIDGRNRLSPNLGETLSIGSGTISNGSIVDIGDGNGPIFVTGLTVNKVEDLIDTANQGSLRRMVRTGWVEKE